MFNDFAFDTKGSTQNAFLSVNLIVIHINTVIVIAVA